MRSSASPSAGAAATVDLGGGLRATVEYGIVRFGREPGGRPAPPPAALAVPGRCRFGEWEVVSERDPRAAAGDLGSVDEPLLDADRLAHTLTVRAWRDGDRMQPLGLDGTKSLQDLFGDRKVPRSLRRSLPGGRVGRRDRMGGGGGDLGATSSVGPDTPGDREAAAPRAVRRRSATDAAV